MPTEAQNLSADPITLQRIKSRQHDIKRIYGLEESLGV